jgi:hypothetical protein
MPRAMTSESASLTTVALCRSHLIRVTRTLLVVLEMIIRPNFGADRPAVYELCPGYNYGFQQKWLVNCGAPFTHKRPRG